MNEQDKQHFEEIIARAVQSGKKETSDLVDTILHRIEPVVEKSIEKYVNGKIKTLDAKFDSYVAGDLAWKEEMTPRLKLVQNAQIFGTVSVNLLKFVSIFGVACGFIYAFFKWIK